MPYVNIKITREGNVTPEQKRQLIEGATKLLADVLHKNTKTLVVTIDEVDMDNWGIGGVPVTELRKIAKERQRRKPKLPKLQLKKKPKQKRKRKKKWPKPPRQKKKQKRKPKKLPPKPLKLQPRKKPSQKKRKKKPQKKKKNQRRNNSTSNACHPAGVLQQ